MSDAPWLDIVGIGADGYDILRPEAKSVLERAEVLLGGERHHALSAHLSAERIAWPKPFDAMIETLRGLKGRRVAMLVTGDPLWYSVGARLLKDMPADELRFWPQLSAFQWASCRLGWSLADVETLTVHGRFVEQAIPFFANGQRLLILANNEKTPHELARLLTDRGFGPSRLHALSWLGAPNEEHVDGLAADWAAQAPELSNFLTLGIELRAAATARPLPRTGLPDDAFEHDGKMTKRAQRVLALAALAPRRRETLWDIGAGCGSIGIEWMRAERDMSACALEPRADRRAMMQANAKMLGAPRLKIIDGVAPDALGDLPAPDAVFIGGGLSRETVEYAQEALTPFGRLVAHAVTLESEALLAALHNALGGELTRAQFAHAAPIGDFRGWRPAMPVTQWVWRKEGAP